MSFSSDNDLTFEEIQNCYNVSNCLANKSGFLSKKIHKIAKIMKPILKKINFSSNCKSWDQESFDNTMNEDKQYIDENWFNEHLEEQQDNLINEALEQHQRLNEINVVAVTPNGTYIVPFTLLPYGADFDICVRTDVCTLTRDQIPQEQVPVKCC